MPMRTRGLEHETCTNIGLHVDAPYNAVYDVSMSIPKEYPASYLYQGQSSNAYNTEVEGLLTGKAFIVEIDGEEELWKFVLSYAKTLSS